jgi:hypothetical protein
LAKIAKEPIFLCFVERKPQQNIEQEGNILLPLTRQEIGCLIDFITKNIVRSNSIFLLFLGF